MNRSAYLATGQGIRILSKLSAAKVILHGTENIPAGSIIFVVNHFTRLETVLMPLHIYQLTKVPVWSLAAHSLFKGILAQFLDKIGVVSTRNPHRDQLIVKSLLTGEANWIIYPEGEMVKDKAILEEKRHLFFSGREQRPAHTGAAVLALRTEFYRQRLARMSQANPDEAKRLMELFGIESLEPVLARNTVIVPVNITYYPLRARENLLSQMAARMFKDISEKALDELMTEGSMLLSQTDIDIRFGEPIEVKDFLKVPAIEKDMYTQHRIDFDDILPSRKLMLRMGEELMHRYMSDIYSMTTVNHDHLFASMLREIPFKKIEEDNLRRRVFLVTAESLQNMGVFLHRSLRSSQLSLLTDDRFKKYREFITLAKAKGIVTKKGETLIKDNSKFSSVFDFNRARIDNPVAVIANEVSPLKQLQRKIWSVAMLAPFQLGHRVSDYLINKGQTEFAEDYGTYFIEGESKPQDIGAPLFIKGRSRELGVVLVHGFLAAPREVKELAAYLGNRGYWVYAPRLKGHGTSPEDLSIRCRNDWVDSVDEGYALISNICRRVVVGGFSFGGGLALDLAARIRNVAGVFAVCPPMKLRDHASKLAPAVGLWNWMMDVAHYDGGKMKFVELTPEHPHINYSRLPVSGINELGKFMAQLKEKLPSIEAPTLVIQADEDPVVDPYASKELFEKVGSEIKDYRLVNAGRHGILLGEGSAQVHAIIGDFIDCLHKGNKSQVKPV